MPWRQELERCQKELREILALPKEFKQASPRLYRMGLSDWLMEEALIRKDARIFHSVSFPRERCCHVKEILVDPVSRTVTVVLCYKPVKRAGDKFGYGCPEHQAEFKELLGEAAWHEEEPAVTKNRSYHVLWCVCGKEVLTEQDTVICPSCGRELSLGGDDYGELA